MVKRPPMLFANLKSMCIKQGKREINYENLLWTYEWIAFRDGIIMRDQHTCTKCSISRYKKLPPEQYVAELEEWSNRKKYYNLNSDTLQDDSGEADDFVIFNNKAKPSDEWYDKSVPLEVHHKYYIRGNLPWHYDENALTTLCADCHEEVHRLKRVTVYKDQKLYEKVALIPCSKCNGTGYLKEYKYHQHGVCFNCWGYGGVMEGTNTNNYRIML